MGVMLLCFRSDGAGRRVGESQPRPTDGDAIGRGIGASLPSAKCVRERR